MGVIDRLCALAAYCFVLEDNLLVAICTFPSTVTLLNNRAVNDDSCDHCLISVHHCPVPYINPVSNRAVIWAEFCGRCSTADTGLLWMSLTFIVTSLSVVSAPLYFMLSLTIVLW